MSDAIKSWKDWHRKISDALGCRVLERSVTLERASELSEQLHQAQTEREEALGRVAQLEVATLNAIQAMPGGKAKAKLRDAYDEEIPSTAWLLRKQAEAVDEALEGSTFYFPYGVDTCVEVEDIREHAQRLRQQADELDKAGGKE